MGAVAQLVNSLAMLTGMHLAPWMAPAALLAVLVLTWPLVRANIRTQDARKLLTRAARERGAARELLETQALELVGSAPDGLVAVAKGALEQGRNPLAAQAVEKLRKTGKRLPELRRLEQALEPPLPGTAAELCIVVERMLEHGLVDQARDRLVRARKKWPFDDEIEALQARIPAR